MLALAKPTGPAPSLGAVRELGARIASAAVLIPLTLGALWLGGLAWIVLIAAAGSLLFVEWMRLCQQPLSRFARAAIVVIVVIACLPAAPVTVPILLLLSLGLLVVWPAKLVAAVPYVGVVAASLVWLRTDAAAGLENTLFLLLVVWASDTAAFAAGRVFRGPRIWPALSGAKTWSGALGGLLAVAVVGAALAALLDGAFLGSGRAIAAAVLLGLAAQAGDLLESGIKRRFGVRHSGALIPGHGGLLDRVDSLMTSAPVACAMAVAHGPGVALWH